MATQPPPGSPASAPSAGAAGTRTLFGNPTEEFEFLEMTAAEERAGRLLRAAAVPARLEALSRRLSDDMHLALQQGRWTPGHPDPAEYTPGDVLALRVFHAGSQVNAARGLVAHARGASAGSFGQALARRAQVQVSQVHQFMTAVPFFLGVTDAVALLASRPADAEVLADARLPFPAVSVYFGADLELHPQLLSWSANLGSAQRRAAADVGVLLAEVPTIAHGDLEAAVQTQGGYLSGVTLFAGPGGVGVDDHVLWHVAANPVPGLSGPSGVDRARGYVWGRRSRSSMGTLADNVAVVAAWGDWIPPPPPPELPEAGSRAWRKALKRGAVRKAARRGAFAGVRVLDTRPAATPPTSRPAAGDAPRRASPQPHPRRGHFRRTRHGPRDNWYYQTHWIRGRVVSLGGVRRDGVTVYRLPVPDDARDALGVDPDDPTGVPRPADRDTRAKDGAAAPSTTTRDPDLER